MKAFSTVCILSECLDDGDCQITHVCSTVNSTSGVCVNPCDSFKSQCVEGTICTVSNRMPSCQGKRGQ